MPEAKCGESLVKEVLRQRELNDHTGQQQQTGNCNREQHTNRNISDTSQNSWDRQGLPEMLHLRQLSVLNTPDSSSFSSSVCDQATRQSSSCLHSPPSVAFHHDDHTGGPGAYMEAPGHEAVRREKTHAYELNHCELNSTGADHARDGDNNITTAPLNLVEEPPSLVFGVSTEEYSQPDVDAAAIAGNSVVMHGLSVSATFLTEAIPVDDDSCADTTSQATPVTYSENERLAKGRARLMGITVATVSVGLLMSIVICVYVLSVVNQDGDDNNVTADGNHTTTTRVPRAIGSVPGLPNYTLEAILASPNSPQARANQWLLGDPNWQNYSEVRLMQRFALATFFYATTGNETTDIWVQDVWVHDRNWLSYDHHECDWYIQTQLLWKEGFDVSVTSENPCSPNGAYERLWLADNDLVGTIPPEVSLLTSLKSVDLQKNIELAGSMSPQIGSLTNLQHLGCSLSALTGSLPSELGKLTRLETVHLLGNHITGTIPSQIGYMTSLDRAVFDMNHLSGLVPTEVAILTNLHSLKMNLNLLTGALPSEIATLSEKLQYLQFGYNALSETIPTDLGLLSSLFSIYLYGNQLTGHIPSELGRLTELREGAFHSNDLTGNIPTEIGNWRHASDMNFDQNNFSLVPSEIGQAIELQQLTLNRNQLQRLPSEIGLLTKLTHLDASANMMQDLPTELGAMSSLQWLNVSFNELAAVSDEIFHLNKLQYLYIDNNQLTDLPITKEDLHTLLNLELSANPLVLSRLPMAMWSLPSLQYLGLGNVVSKDGKGNPIPTEIARLTSLILLDYHNTTWTGKPPSEIGSMTQLALVDLDSTGITGEIPVEWTGLATNGSMELLSMVDTLLSGTVPLDLCNVTLFTCSQSLCGCNCTCGE